jgi:hypothetical protein
MGQLLASSSSSSYSKQGDMVRNSINNIELQKQIQEAMEKKIIPEYQDWKTQTDWIEPPEHDFTFMIYMQNKKVLWYQLHSGLCGIIIQLHHKNKEETDEHSMILLHLEQNKDGKWFLRLGENAKQKYIQDEYKKYHDNHHQKHLKYYMCDDCLLLHDDIGEINSMHKSLPRLLNNQDPIWSIL